MRGSLLIRLHRRRSIGGLAASVVIALGLLATAGAVTAHAYPTPGDTLAVQATCTTVPQGGTCGVTGTLSDSNGNPVSGETVNWTVSGCGSVDPTTGVTNSQGQVTTTFTASRSCCTPATITATAPSPSGDITGSTVIQVTCAGQVAGLTAGGAASVGLPNTSGSPSAGSPPFPAWAVSLLVGAVVAILGGAVYLRRGRRLVQ
jgi:hypothetical protein